MTQLADKGTTVWLHARWSTVTEPTAYSLSFCMYISSFGYLFWTQL